MSGRLEGKIALITGAAGGLGQAMARRMAEEGAKLALTDIDEAGARALAAAINAEHPDAAFAYGHDVTDEAQWVEVIERALWPEELESFEQFFLTGSAAEVTSVQSAGPWNFEIGDLSRQLARDYDDLVNGRLANG